jgi:hypothetical protein
MLRRNEMREFCKNFFAATNRQQLKMNSLGVLATISVIFGSACGSESSINNATMTTSSPEEVSVGVSPASVSNSIDATSAEALAEISDIIYGLHGSSEQHLRQVQDGFAMSQRALHDCMAEGGFDYVIPEVEFGDYGSPVLPRWYTEPDPDRASVEGFGIVVGNPWANAVLIAVPQKVYDSLSAEQRAKYDATLGACPSVEGGLTAEEKGALGLSFELEQTLETVLIDKSFDPTRSKYSACLEASIGLSIENPYEASDLVVGARTTGKIGGGTPQEVELAVAVVEAKCRLPLVDEIAKFVVPAFKTWMATNADKVEAMLVSLGS